METSFPEVTVTVEAGGQLKGLTATTLGSDWSLGGDWSLGSDWSYLGSAIIYDLGLYVEVVLGSSDKTWTRRSYFKGRSPLWC
jgi:hypothetical protein